MNIQYHQLTGVHHNNVRGRCNSYNKHRPRAAGAYAVISSPNFTFTRFSFFIHGVPSAQSTRNVHTPWLRSKKKLETYAAATLCHVIGFM